MSSNNLQKLLRVLSDRDIDLGADEVAWAFESSKTRDSINSWVQEYLHPNTLLTKEELSFFNKNAPNKLSAPSRVRHIPDEEFDRAIEQLEASTTAIEEQCRVLETQKEALRRIKSRNISPREMEESRSNRSNRYSRERAKLDISVGELTTSMQTQLQASLKQLESEMSTTPLSIDKILEKDDRLLDGLDKLLPQLSNPVSIVHESKEVDALCEALITLSAAEIRAQLDNTYSIATNMPTNDIDEPSAAESKSTAKQSERTRAELGELCREIDGLSAMAVDSQYRAPISQMLDTARLEAETDRESWCEYAGATLEYLTSRLDVLNHHLQSRRGHSNALHSVFSALDYVTAVSITKQESTNDDSSPNLTPNGKGLRPLRLVQANLSEAQEPAALLLRHLDVKSSDQSDILKFADDLDTSTQTRAQKLQELAHATEQTISGLLEQHLTKTNVDQAELDRIIHAHSTFGTVTLVDQQTQSLIEQLQQKTEQLSDQMRGFDMDSVMRAVKQAQQNLLRDSQ